VVNISRKINSKIMSETIHSYVKLFLPLGITLLGAWLAYKRYLKDKEDKKDLIINAVFGDLANLIEHYSYAKNELFLILKSPQEQITRIRMSQFGVLRSIEKIELLGNLNSSQIRALLQINLRVRNTDQLLQDMLKIDKITANDLERIQNRMSYCAKSANILLKTMIEKRKDLGVEYERFIKNNSNYLGPFLS
jgi:hypothetical protein